MYKIAICDDDAADRKWLLQAMLDHEKCPDEIFIHQYGSGEELLGDMQNHDFAAIFLDVQMGGGMDGIATAMQIREQDSGQLLVFVSGFATPAPEGSEVLPYRYLLKQMTEEVINRNMGAIFREMEFLGSMPVIKAKNGLETIRLRPSDILYAEKHRRKVRFHLTSLAMGRLVVGAEDEVLTTDSLDQVYKVLGPYGFGYPHDSYILNFDYIVSNRSSKCRLDGVDRQFHISRSKFKEFKELLHIYETAKYTKGWLHD